MTRNIALAEETYAALAARKRRGQSFSDAVAELLDLGRPSLHDVVGIANDDGHWERFGKERRDRRRGSMHRVDLER